MDPRPSDARRAHIERLYGFFEALHEHAGGYRRLGASSPAGWPSHGVYFFFDEGERRTSPGAGLRCVRVGTHALLPGSKSTLWSRLRQHRGHKNGGGAHHKSVFRRLVGQALIARDGLEVPSWCDTRPAPGPVLVAEVMHERRVSAVIRVLPLLVLSVPDMEQRSRIERGLIALLSNAHDAPPIDPPSERWLGHHSPSKRVKWSGLWNQNHVLESYSPAVLDELQQLVSAMRDSPAR